jgi:hypothetical protein
MMQRNVRSVFYPQYTGGCRWRTVNPAARHCLFPRTVEYIADINRRQSSKGFP